MTNRILALAVAVLVAALPGAAEARLIPNASGNSFNLTTNPPTADLWCNGGQIAANSVKAYTELCQDYTGSFLPTSALGTQNLGSSAFPFATVYSVNASVTGAEINGTAGTMNAAGTGGTATTLSTVSGLQVFGKSVVSGVVISTTIPANSSYITVLSTGGTVTLTSVPNISTTTVIGGTTEIPSGTFLVISSTATGSAVVFQDGGTLTGSQLQLGASSRSVSQYKTLTLIYDATDHMWREIAYGNN